MDKISVIITGSTGMVGKGVLLECLDNPSISGVLVINRHPLGINHPKLREIIHSNFYDLSSIEKDLQGFDACFFCMGVSSFRMKEQDYHRVTYDLTLHVADTLLRLNSDMVFCYVSGLGTDSTEKGKVMWACVKGKTENALLAMPFRRAYMFRPAYIHPMRGIKSRTPLYNFFIVIFRPLYPVLKLMFPSMVTTTEAVGKAMITVATRNVPEHILDPPAINRLATE